MADDKYLRLTIAELTKLQDDPTGSKCKDEAWLEMKQESYRVYVLGKGRQTKSTEEDADKVNNTIIAGESTRGYSYAEDTGSVEEVDENGQKNTAAEVSDDSEVVAYRPALSKGRLPELRAPLKRARSPKEEQSSPRKKGTSNRKGLKKGEQIGEARLPGAAIKKFNTQRYQEFRWGIDYELDEVDVGKFLGNYSIFDRFKLLTGPISVNIRRYPIPRWVRADDRWVGYVSLHHTNKELCKYWPADFDSNGMLRATRVPLGDPCLIWVSKGHEDVDGIPAKEDGLFYAWYRGLQPLYGQEKFEAYMVRPSHEKIKCKHLGFRVDCPADGDRTLADFHTRSVDQNTIVVFADKEEDV